MKYIRKIIRKIVFPVLAKMIIADTQIPSTDSDATVTTDAVEEKVDNEEIEENVEIDNYNNHMEEPEEPIESVENNETEDKMDTDINDVKPVGNQLHLDEEQ